MTTAKKLPPSKVVLFALGQFGWSLCSFGVANLMNYFYMPPRSGEQALFPTYIYSGHIFGILTLLGVITAIARAFDAITNPLIASWSDRNTSRLGRRTFFLAFSLLPFAILSVLLFVPLTNGESLLNAIWLSGVILAFYFFFVCYTTPYSALLSEYGHTPAERLSLSTALSVAWSCGFAIGQQVYALQAKVVEMFAATPTRAFQIIICSFTGISLVCMALPILFIKEREYAEAHVSKENVRQALVSAFKNRNFVRFLSADFMYWVALTFVQMGMVYYVTILLHPHNDIHKDSELVSPLMTVLFLVSFVCYAPVNVTTKKFGKKPVMLAGFALFAVVFCLVAGMGLFPIPGILYAYLVAIFAAVPVAIFGILPGVVISDIAEVDGRRSGNHKAGMFFGTRTFVMNFGIAAANFLFPSMLLLGNDVQNSLGVRLSSAVAVAFCILGFVLFSLYDEKSILVALESEPSVSPSNDNVVVTPEA
jgi:glycoside/pentoside/hexuronide:cation symporter, GPH family